MSAHEPMSPAALAWVRAWADENAPDPAGSARQNYDTYVHQVGRERCSMPPEPIRVVQVPDVPILADWDHANCGICAKVATEPEHGA